MKLTLTLIITLGFIIGCGTRGSSSTRIVENKPQQAIQQKQPITHSVPQRKLPPAPKRTHKPKKVEDTNYSDAYMYPEDGVAAKKDPIVKTETSETAVTVMSKEECISMIGQEKFDKYTTIFGSEAASLKRCTMLKAMKK